MHLNSMKWWALLVLAGAVLAVISYLAEMQMISVVFRTYGH
jgi:hypothetical protein